MCIRQRTKINDRSELRDVLQEHITALLGEEIPLSFADSKPTVYLIVGVNGVGKTTTIGKLAKNLQGQGKNVLLAAGDTFRAAAIEQLEVWGERSGTEVIKQSEGADPLCGGFRCASCGKIPEYRCPIDRYCRKTAQ